MSDARHGRFEIDLDEIERQLRRAAEPPVPAPAPRAELVPQADVAPKGDPLAELARIVGQDDPFRGMFRDDPPAHAAPAHAPMAPPLRSTLDANDAHAAPAAAPAPFGSDMDVVLHGNRSGAAPEAADDRPDDLFDPVADVYGSLDRALDEDRHQTLTPPRSRKGLMVVGSLVVAAGLGTAGWLAWRDSGAKLAVSGAPPVIKADNAPLKVAPENPGGMEIPDQNKQIYERGAQDGQTRVVDRQEQPIDVREAARALPPVPEAGSASNARAGRANPVASALGEPRRVRTVSVRPDGTLTDAPPSPAPAPTPPMISSGSLPPPVPVATIPITANGTSATPAPAAAPASTASAGATPMATPAPVTVLPPRRPKFETRSELVPSDETSAPQPGAGPARRVASAAPEEEDLAAPVGKGRFAVQLGVRGSEQEARAAFKLFAGKYPELDGRSPVITPTESGGKTVYRVRVGNLSQDEAKTLCSGVQGSGGQCFVLKN